MIDRFKLFSKHSWCSICALIALACFQPSVAELSFAVWTVDTSHTTHDPIVVDVNGDGLKDLVLPQYFPSTGRELHIYLQEANEKLANSPLKIEIKSETIGFAMADVREAPGTEIIWLTADAVYSYSANEQGYVGNLEHLADWELFIRHPDAKELLYLEAVDMNNDGFGDLVLPGPHRFGLFFNNAANGLDFRGSINTEYMESKIEAKEVDSWAHRSRGAQTTSLLEVNNAGELSLKNIEVYNSYSQLLFREIDLSDHSTRSISFNYWLPNAITRDIDGDGLLDLLVKRSAFDLGTSSLNGNTIDESPPDGFTAYVEDSLNSPVVIHHIPLFGRQVYSLDDIDGDGDLDVVCIESGITSSTVYLFVNDKNQFNKMEPAQVLRVNGVIMAVEFEAISRGSPPHMLINTVTTPLRKILSELELHRNMLLFSPSMDGKGIFDQKPSITSTHSINLDSLRNLMPTTVSIDLDVDGVSDILECKSDGTIQARRITDSSEIESTPYWQFTPEYTVFSVQSDDIDSDQLPDLILNHSSAVTILVSR